ncbi:MAG: hypothetical protein MK078_04985 [Crocinitomicaceae bacterium]|nr:hypothetical protein [Crocinitomicaceae bacterium]
MGELIMENKDTTNPVKASFTKTWNANFSFGFNYRPNKWISYHFGYTCGATLAFLENVPRKHQITYGARIAPFHKAKWGLFRCMRIELLAINGFFPDINAQQIFPITVYPYIY